MPAQTGASRSVQAPVARVDPFWPRSVNWPRLTRVYVCPPSPPSFSFEPHLHSRSRAWLWALKRTQVSITAAGKASQRRSRPASRPSSRLPDDSTVPREGQILEKEARRAGPRNDFQNGKQPTSVCFGACLRLSVFLLEDFYFPKHVSSLTFCIIHSAPREGLVGEGRGDKGRQIPAPHRPPPGWVQRNAPNFCLVLTVLLSYSLCDSLSSSGPQQLDKSMEVEASTRSHFSARPRQLDRWSPEYRWSVSRDRGFSGRNSQ